VEQVLADLGAAGKPRVVALNKVDLLGPSARRRAVGAISVRYPDAVAISARNKAGFAPLLDAVDKASRGEVTTIELLVPYGREGVLAELRRIGGVERTEYAQNGTLAWGWVPTHAARRFDSYAVPAGKPARARLA